MSPKILEKMSKKQAPTIMGAITGEGVDGEGGEEGLEEDLRGLKEDYLYLKKMQVCLFIIGCFCLQELIFFLLENG